MKEDKDKTQLSTWEDLETLLHSLATPEKPIQLTILGDIFKAAIKLSQENPGTLNLKIAATALKELRFSFKMFGPHRHQPKITIFGSARVPPGDKVYNFARDFARDAVKRKYKIITGGGPGIMAAGNEGADSEGFGLNIRLPFEQSANPFIDSENMLIHYKYFFTRKLFLVKEAAAVVLFPGGFGTFDEAFEVLTLMQTGKTNVIPLVLAEPEGFGFWENFVEFIESTVLKKGFISPPDMHLIRIAHSPTEAMDEVDKFYRNYHSYRFVKDKISIRLKKPLDDAVMARLNDGFSFLADNKPMTMSGPLKEEANEPELNEFSRLVFPFDRKDFGNLRRLIDFVNEQA